MYTETLGEDVRNVFKCALSKLRTTEGEEIEAHLESCSEHSVWERAADSLQASRVNQNKRIADCKQRQQQEQKDPAQRLMEDVWMGFSPGDQVKRFGAAQSAVCNTSIPFLFHAVQQNLKSSEHANSKRNYRHLTLLNNPTLKAKFDVL
ncbi:hypothetical protein scyTo_0026287 [Scyliorhinus torazame]|uniref:Uncharacterized protein n=1 Tax=Scyliorhinus torazame TaxID=75743 RepID=A0A401QJT0_SCYTO|nr:hypothetical protein [Scyliorhinus torazame]